MRYIKKKYYRKKENYLKYIMAFMFLGSLLGAIFFCFIPESSIKKLDMFVNSFILHTNDDNNSIDAITLIGIFLKDTKYLIFIWFLAFIHFGDIFIYLVIFNKGFFIGFTSAIFFYNQGIVSIFNNFLENMVNIILIFYISYKAINYYKNKNIQIDIKSYIKSFIICIIINIILFFIFYYIK